MFPLHLRPIAALLLFTSLITIVQAPFAQAASFSDLENHWATPSIYKAAALDLLSGYPDGRFRPQKSVTQLELIALLVRASAPDNKSKKPSLANLSLPKVSWGADYLAYAVENGLITHEELAGFNPEAPATRAMAALSLSRLLKLPAVVPYDYTDSGQMTAEERDAASAVASLGLMSGYPDNSFRPRQHLTRAEAAVLLANLVKEGWSTNISETQVVEGWIRKITVKGGSMEAELISPLGSYKLRLASDLKCWSGNNEVKPEQAVNHQVKAYMSKNKLVSFLDVGAMRPDTSDNYVIGSFKSVVVTGKENILVINDLKCEEQRLTLSPFVLFEDLSGTPLKAGFKGLKPLSFVKAYLNEDQVVRVSLIKTSTMSGTVKGFSGYRMYITGGGSKNRPEWFNYYDRARVVDKSGNRYGSLLRGDKVQITYVDIDPNGIDDELPLEIMVTTRPPYKKVSGTVQSLVISGSHPQVTIAKNKIYEIDPAAVSAFTGVKAGDKIEFMIDGAEVIMQLTKVTSP